MVLLRLKSHPSWVCGLKQSYDTDKIFERGVTPFVGVWIETANFCSCCYRTRVTPFVGVWIETLTSDLLFEPNKSHPSWVCGLKQYVVKYGKIDEFVTPFVGVWIETKSFQLTDFGTIVTPFVGVWIETTYVCFEASTSRSHPSWVCGLKQMQAVVSQT